MYNIELEDIEAEISMFLNPENAFFAIYEDATIVGHAVFGQKRVSLAAIIWQTLLILGQECVLIGQGKAKAQTSLRRL
jgi:hypothetical protein